MTVQGLNEVVLSATFENCAQLYRGNRYLKQKMATTSSNSITSNCSDSGAVADTQASKASAESADGNRARATDEEEGRPFIGGVETPRGKAASGSRVLLILIIAGIVLALVFFIGTLLIEAGNATNNGETCPGNMILTDCPCAPKCNEDTFGLDASRVIATSCPHQEKCQRGCGCPREMPFLLQSQGGVATTCSAVCLKPKEVKDAQPELAVDFSDCPPKHAFVKVQTREDAVLYQQEDTEVFHVRVSPTYTCPSSVSDDEDGDSLDVLLHFTLLRKGDQADCAQKPLEHFVSYFSRRANAYLMSQPEIIGCLRTNSHDEFDASIRGAWFFYAMRLKQVAADDTVKYFVGVKKKQLMSSGSSSVVATHVVERILSTPLAAGKNNPDKPILVLGDTAHSGLKIVAPAAFKQRQTMATTKAEVQYSLAIHVGDASYATNRGDCYTDKGDDPSGRCGYDCKGVNCHGADKVQSEEMLTLYRWAKTVDESLGGKMTWVSTMGNHDNDIMWFLTYRPPIAAAVPGVANVKPFPMLSWGFSEYIWRFVSPSKSNAEKQAEAMEVMKSPHFFSFDHGLMHVIQIGTEDNPINAYETWNGQDLPPAKKDRWEKHFGKSSPQYEWLERDLKRAVANRQRVPWIVIYTHRPMYHTAQHHAWCSPGGDWYACLFVETYEPLLIRYGVNLFLAGHSHHYQRSFPMHKQKMVGDKGTTHMIVGVGGFDVVGENWVRKPEWLASRQGTTLGYARFWVKNSTYIYWEHVAAESGKVLDSVYIKNGYA